MGLNVARIEARRKGVGGASDMRKKQRSWALKIGVYVDAVERLDVLRVKWDSTSLRQTLGFATTSGKRRLEMHRETKSVLMSAQKLRAGSALMVVASGQIAVQITKEKLDSLIIQYQKELGMRNLDFTSVSGVTHLIELSADAMVPSNWVKVNSTKKTVRYHPPEVLATLDKLALAKEEFAVTCRNTWTNFLTSFGKYYAQFQAAVQALAALDCLHSLAILSRNQKQSMFLSKALVVASSGVTEEETSSLISAEAPVNFN
ncbi:DNA mismatch repair protein MSH3 [Platanthera guangdongensis]|uniref:DNA mismatch repair protein MSH3 n=1 Tax=Platanthera guangdongensis TaxID=2320717 RepID=A0ABR2MQ73_9ASPA